MAKRGILRLMDSITDDAAAYEYLEGLRWNGQPVCPHCGNDDRCYFLAPRNGVSRETSTGAASQRRLWKCGECRRKFSVLTGTVMHGSKISTRLWVLVFFEMASSKNGVSAREIERKYGVSAKTAWHLLHRVRVAMGNDGPVQTMRGDIVADETWIGGRLSNKHRQGQVPGRVGGRGRAGTPKNRTPVVTLLNTSTGEARSRVVRDVTGATLAKVLREQVDTSASTLQTDGHLGYRDVGREFVRHRFVDHSKWIYVGADGTTTNACEGFFSNLKSSISGTHHKVSREHLPLYLGEFDLRYTTRKMSDEQRMAKMIRQADGVRLAYRSLKAS